MAELIRDTFFGYSLRLLFGSRVLSHPDETDLPMVWQKAVHEKQATPTSSGANSIHEETHDDPPNGQGGHGTIDEKKHRSTPTQRKGSVASLRSAVTVVDAAGVSKQDSEKGDDTLLVGWYGPEDPDNPQNWSSRKKSWVLVQTLLLTFSIYIGSAIYTAGIAGVSQEFHVSIVAATVGLTTFVGGYGLGPMVWSPLSELPQVGRMPIYIITLALFVVLQIPTALSTNYGMLMAFRFLTGFVGSPILATGGATIADMYSAKKRAYGITLWGVTATCGPVMGPLIGGFATHAKDWRWTIWELMWLSGFCFIVLFFFFPETSASNILYRRAKRLRKATGNTNLRSQSEIDAAHMSKRDLAVAALVRPFTLNFQEPIVLALNIYIGLIYALLYIWFESFPIVFIGIYHFKTQLLGLAFLGVLVGAFVTIPPFFAYLYYVQEPMYNERGELRPEARMPVAIFGAVLVPICMFWFGWTSRESIHWIVPIIGSGLFSIAALLLFNVVLNYLADTYPVYAASVLAGNDLIRSAFGAGFPLFAGGMYRNLGVGWASSLLGFLACAFIPIPILLWKYGERIRMSSKRARHDFD
ncbi:MFS transporter [Auriscalpium vulgare]|uniref:MFS transporter n=1 Tax=Auriscalpium vulgare TaxID=40419 RepID=A0ACB8RG35_9AGAM|nr:MFS transporter [Auriscalpium vulgare]